MILSCLVILSVAQSDPSVGAIYTKEQIRGELKVQSNLRSYELKDAQIQRILMTELIAVYTFGNDVFQKNPLWSYPGERAVLVKTQNQNIRALQAWWMLRVGSLTFPDIDNVKPQKIKNPDGSVSLSYDFTKGHPMTLSGDKIVKSLKDQNCHAFFYEVCRYWGDSKYGKPTKMELEKAMETAPKEFRYLLIGPLARMEAKEGKKVRWWVEWKNLLKNPNRPLLVQHMLEQSKILQQP